MVFLKPNFLHRNWEYKIWQGVAITNVLSFLGCEKTMPIFSWVVDGFGAKYTNKQDVEHLMSVLKQDYKWKKIGMW